MITIHLARPSAQHLADRAHACATHGSVPHEERPRYEKLYDMVTRALLDVGSQFPRGLIRIEAPLESWVWLANRGETLKAFTAQADITAVISPLVVGAGRGKGVEDQEDAAA